VSIVPILLGVGGVVYKQHTREALRWLGVTSSLLGTTLNDLHTLAIKHAHTIVCTRRQLERSGAPG